VPGLPHLGVEKWAHRLGSSTFGLLHEEAIVNCVNWQVSRYVVIYDQFFSSHDKLLISSQKEEIK